MNKTFKRILQVSGVVVGLIGLFFIGFMIMLKLEINKMTPLETKELTDNVTTIKDEYVNMYLIKDETGYIAIDAGNDLNIVEQNLIKMKINPGDVTAVFLTHSDFDHAAAITLFKNADIYLSQQEEQMINGSTSRFYFIENKINTTIYHLLEDRQVINIGNTTIQGILTPGHTPGSMCYLIKNEYLFTGDALSLNNGKIEGFNEIFNMDTETAGKSICKLTNLPEVQYIFTAHHGYSDDYENAVNNWR